MWISCEALRVKVREKSVKHTIQQMSSNIRSGCPPELFHSELPNHTYTQTSIVPETYHPHLYVLQFQNHYRTAATAPPTSPIRPAPTSTLQAAAAVAVGVTAIPLLVEVTPAVAAV